MENSLQYSLQMLVEHCKLVLWAPQSFSLVPKLCKTVLCYNPCSRGYMAPELIDNQQISCKSDIFSLGIIMKKILPQSDETPTENVRIFTSL